MMHHEVDYSGLTELEKFNKAMRDIKDYLGEERFENISQTLRDNPKWTLDEWRIALSFAGVQGYPAKAWFVFVRHL